MWRKSPAKISPPGVSFSLPLFVSQPRVFVLRHLILDFSFGSLLSQQRGLPFTRQRHRPVAVCAAQTPHTQQTLVTPSYRWNSSLLQKDSTAEMKREVSFCAWTLQSADTRVYILTCVIKAWRHISQSCARSSWPAGGWWSGPGDSIFPCASALWESACWNSSPSQTAPTEERRRDETDHQLRPQEMFCFCCTSGTVVREIEPHRWNQRIMCRKNVLILILFFSFCHCNCSFALPLPPLSSSSSTL